MVLGMDTFTFVHVLISLLAIGSGLLVGLGLLGAKRMDGLTALFLTTTVLTSVTGFMFPFNGLTPGYYVGAISIVVLTIAIVARYPKQLVGGWRTTYVITAMLAQWLNVFVLIAQLFRKVPAMHALAPLGNEPPFLISQVTVMVVYIIWTALAAKKFRGAVLATA